MLYSFNEVSENIFRWLLGIDAAELAAVLLHDKLQEGTVLQELFLDMRVLIFSLVDQTIQDGVISEVLRQNEVMHVGHWIKSSLLQLLVYQMVAHVKTDEQIWLLVKFLEHAYLVHGRWCSLNDPSVCLAISHEKSLPKQLHDDMIRDSIPTLDDLPELFG